MKKASGLFLLGKIWWGRKGYEGCDNSPPALQEAARGGCCLALLTASTGAGIERLNLQQGRFHLDTEKKLFSSKDVKHRDKPGRL